MNCQYDSQSEDIPVNEVTCALKIKQKINHKTNISKSEEVLSLTSLEREGLGFFITSLEVQVPGANAVLNAACLHNIFYS